VSCSWNQRSCLGEWGPEAFQRSRKQEPRTNEFDLQVLPLHASMESTFQEGCGLLGSGADPLAGGEEDILIESPLKVLLVQEA
jgi:hypothetical protein